MQTIKIIKPDDWHLHLRDGEMLKSVLKMTAAQMGRAIIMPNLSPPICDLKAARAYKNEIIHALPEGNNFTPLMVLYLTNNTSPAQIEEAAKSPEVVAAKLYPAGATTNSDAGVSDIINIYPALEALQKQQMPLLVHGEVVREDVDIFDREAVFIDEVLSKIIRDFPDLKVVFEHISTKQAADFVLENNSNIAATITAHHLLANRNDMLKGGINPHLFCLPILKSRNPHQLALLDAAISGNPKFFLGTDSAPHEQSAKQSACGCAGIFTAGTAIELYATAFEEQNALDKLESFASIFGADFYNLPHNTTTITLKKSPQTIPTSYPTPTSKIIPFWPGKTLNWQLNN